MAKWKLFSRAVGETILGAMESEHEVRGEATESRMAKICETMKSVDRLDPHSSTECHVLPVYRKVWSGSLYFLDFGHAFPRKDDESTRPTQGIVTREEEERLGKREEGSLAVKEKEKKVRRENTSLVDRFFVIRLFCTRRFCTRSAPYVQFLFRPKSFCFLCFSVLVQSKDKSET